MSACVFESVCVSYSLGMIVRILCVFMFWAFVCLRVVVFHADRQSGGVSVCEFLSI